MKTKFTVTAFLAVMIVAGGLVMSANATSNNSTAQSGVDSIFLTGNGGILEWTVDGYSNWGYKVVWSKNPHPEYPTRSGDRYHYYADPTKRGDTIDAFAGAGVYYARVCEYLSGGQCGAYSNEVAMAVAVENNFPTCKDTDISDNVHSKDKVYGRAHSEGASVLSDYKTYDHCADDGTAVMEMYCAANPDGDGLVAESKEIDCEYGCEDGVCRTEVPACVGEGKLTSGAVSPEYQYGCCEGLESFNPHPADWVGGGMLCYDPAKGKPMCLHEGEADEGWYYHETDELLLARECSDSANAGAETEEPVACTMEYAPVCGTDGVTYSNDCVATSQNGVEVAYAGECKKAADDNTGDTGQKDDDLSSIEDKAQKLANNMLEDILSELQALRDLVEEQQNRIRHLERLLQGVSAVTEQMQDAINNFITYGVDENTKKLGEGERAAVMYSYKEAFGKLPEDEGDLEDAIRIANGRWPSETNAAAEEAAKDKFERIYKREPDMDDPRDNAAVTVMAYGLRQKAENRKLESEKQGIKIFKGIFGHVPQTTEEWNIMQAITYSGATR